MKNSILLNRSGMSPEVTCRKGRHAIESIVSRFSLASLICLCMLTIGSGNVWGQSTTYTSNVTFTAGANGSTCKVKVTGSTQYDGMKLGTSSKTGTMTFTVPAGTTTIHIHAAGWNGDGNSRTLNISTSRGTLASGSTSMALTNDAGVSSSSPFTLSTPANASTSYYKSLSISGVTGGTATITITTSSKRAVVWGVNAVVPASCTTNPTVTAGSNSSVTATTATVSCSSGISSLGSAGCSITDYGFVIGTSANPAIGGSGVTKHQVGTTYTVAGTSFSKNLTELSAETTYYVRPYATNGNGTAYGTQTSFTTPALPKYTVTLKDDDTELEQASSGASITLPSRTGCTGYTFAGWTKTWVAEQSSWTTTAPTIIPAGSYTPEADENLYPVYTKTESGGGGEPTAYSVGDEGDYVLAALNKNDSKWYAIPTSPTLTSGKIDGSEITVNESAGGVNYVTTSNASGYTWTIAKSGSFYTISDGTSYLYHATGGASGTNLGYGNSTDYIWSITNDNGLVFAGVVASSSTVGNRGLLYQDNYSSNPQVLNKFGGYALSNKDGGGFSRIQVLPIGGGSTTSYISVPSCGAVYDLTFKEWDGGGTASGDPSTGTVTANATSFSFGATPPSKDGYQIEGFYTNTSASSGVKVADGSRNFIASVTDWTNSSSEYTKGSNATLYIKWEAQHYTITYDKGEYGTGDAIAAGDKTHGVSFTLSSSTFTRDGYTQDGWSTSDGGDKAYDLGGSYTANAAITLYPHWTINNYTVSWSVNGSNWTDGVTSSNDNADYNTTVSAPTAPTSSDCDGSKVFVGWTDAEYSDDDTAPGVLFTSTSSAITANTTFYAVFAEASGGGGAGYELVTSSSDAFSDGDEIIIVGTNSGSYYGLGCQRKNDAGDAYVNNRAAISISVSENVTNPTLAASSDNTSNVYPLQLEAISETTYFRIKDVANNAYLYANGGTGSSPKNAINFTSLEDNDNQKWSISANSSGVAAIQVAGGATRNTLRFNSTNTVNSVTVPIFSCYLSTNQENVYIYRKSVSYSNYSTTCCQQPATQLAIAADKTELVRSGAVNFTLTGGNGQDITWSCRDEADENCDALLSSTSNSGATLTISTPVSATKTYTVRAVQPEDDDDAEVVCGKTVTMDITVKAQWTITFKTTDDSSLSTYSTETVTDGESYTFPDLSDEYTCETNYSFVGWRATNTAGAPEYAGGSSATASEDKTWYAVWMYSTGTTTETRDKYELVTSSSTAIAEDDVVVIACNTQGVALAQMSTSDTYGSPVAVDFATDKSYLTFASGTNVMELKVLYYDSEGSWYFQDNASSSYYINYTENATLTYKSSFWTWTITPDASGNANIVDYEASSYKLQYRKETSRFAFYTGSNKAVQLYRKNGTVSVEVPAAPTYYVNNEHCTNGATIRAAEGQWVTSAKDQKVRITVPVIAKNFKTSGKQLTASSGNSHFSVSFPSHTIPSDKSEVVVNMVVEYTPIEANTIEEANITITTGTGDGNATKVISVNGRSLPDEFVIVTQKEGKWQALPADMFSGTGTYSPIEVTPNGGITAIPAAPYTTIYSAREVASGQYETAGTCVRLVGNNNKCLWANNSNNGTGIQNFAALGNTNGSQYEWLLSTADGEQYTIANPAHPDYSTGRQLGIYTLKYGLYKTTDIFYLLPVGCSSQPGNLQITPRRVDAMFSWETNAASVTIDLWTNEAMSEGHKQAVVTSVPYQFTGLAESTKYWYKITPGSDDDCALTGSFSTTGPTIELVEWGENSATIFVDKDEAVDPQIIIAGEVEHGQGGTAATDIFFSKYFEAQEKAKMLAIYNGTGNAISLADITIVQRANAAALSLAKYGKTPGFIQPGEEIILYYPSSVSAIMDCAKAEESFSTWNDVSGETGSSNLDFGGKGTIRMFRGSTCIDIIGAMASDATAADMNSASVKPIDGSGYPTFGDDNGFVSTSGDNYETDEEENTYELSTNRCLLIRKPHVVSGDSAVLNNFGDFKTLGTYTGVDSKTHKGEWAGLQIPNGPTGDKYHYTCEGFKDVGVFDYNKYYRDYSQIGEDKYLSDFTRAADGTYTLSIAGMRQYACLNLKFQLTEHDNKANVLTEQTVQVPIVVKDARNSNDTLFNNIIKADEAPHTPMVPQSIERCKTCNVVVLGTGTLTKAADGTTNDVAELRDVKVYPGGKLIVPEGTHYVINSLSLRRQEDLIASAKINAGLSSDPSDVTKKGLYIRESNGVYLDVRIDPSNWHYFTLPYDCRVGDIRFSDGTPAKVNNDYLLGWYDGAYRAEHKEGGWTDITDDDYVLKKGLGYIVALPGNGLIKRELRFPMANEVISAELADKEVGGLYAYGGNKTDEELRPNHKGWNMIGNPYLYDYTTDIVKEPLAIGELKHDPEGSSWNGKWVRTGSARYIVAPIDNGWSGYEQTTISNMKPFMSYFIQIGTRTDGKDNPETERSILFDKDQKPASIIRRRAQAEDSESMWPVWYGIEMTAPNAEKDNTTLLISDEFTDGYDMMDDLIKMRGDYYKYYPYPVLASRNNEGEMAFNALPDASAAENGVPLNYYAAAAGTYTISTDSRYDLEEVKSAMLYDATNNTYTDLLAQNYEFTTAKGDNTNRFTLYVRVERKKAPEIATGTDNILTDGKLSLIAIDKTLVLSGLTDAADVYVYDMSGKMIKSEHGAGNGIWRATVPATGVYFVRVNSATGQQTLRAIVK